MPWSTLPQHFSSAAAELRALAARLISAGPAKCLRLAVASVAGILALACVPALVLATLLILVPVALVIVVFGGLALALWPFALPAWLQTGPAE